MDKFQQSFLEEARELLTELESALLDLDQSNNDAELVGRAFRALHTIKGSGSMFGFQQIATFTHELENAFDLVRNGKLSASTDLISLSLAAGDQLRAMLDEVAGSGCADSAISTGILRDLRALTGITENHPVSQMPENQGRIESLNNSAREWHIHFQPKADLLRNGANPLLLFRELREMGILSVQADTSGVPAFADLDPECCYVTWNLALTTSAEEMAIRDVFLFVEDSCELSFEMVSQLPQCSATSIPPMQPERRSSEDRRSADKNEQASSIRVPAGKLDQLVDLVGQLVTVQARLTQIAARYDDHDMQTVAEEIECLTAGLRENSMSMRTLPLRPTFERFKRLVYDLGRNLKKEVEFTFEGGETDLDKTVIDQLGDPLMHLIRNSMDHGIEEPEVRRASGKKPVASVHLAARHAGAQVLISVSDDGRGIDREAVRVRGIEKGLISAEAKLGDSEIFSLIMAPGFSTAREITDVSGRGVGMDVVRRNIEALRGSIDISSQQGVGTTITLRLPLTLAIIDGLLVRVGHAHFVMPLANTLECVELTRQDIEDAGGKHLAHIRGEIVPYIRLSEYLEMQVERQEREQIMVAETEQGRFGFVVDEVLGHHQTVIKNLGRLYRNIQFVSGATILGDGTLALILDLHRLVQDAIREATVKQTTGACTKDFD